MNITKLILLSSILSLPTLSGLYAATIAIDNFNDGFDSAYGIRDAGGTLVSGSDFKGVIGRFTITNSAISTNFGEGNLTAISAGFQQFDPTVTGVFGLDNYDAGAFDAQVIFDTKTTSNSFGGSAIYMVLYKGASIAAATELFVAQMNSVFPTDPNVGAPLTGSVSLRPSNITDLVVGTQGGAAHDYGFDGGGPLPTFGLAAIPEPSRMMLLGLGLVGFGMRRRRGGLV
jgi:hypothetical protein